MWKTESEGVTEPVWNSDTKSKGGTTPSLDDQAVGPKYKTRTQELIHEALKKKSGLTRSHAKT